MKVGEPTLEWANDERSFSAGHVLRAGKFIVASAGWSKLRKDDPPYVACCRLPGMKDTVGRFDTLDEAKAKAERAVRYWFEKVSQPIKKESQRD